MNLFEQKKVKGSTLKLINPEKYTLVKVNQATTNIITYVSPRIEKQKCVMIRRGWVDIFISIGEAQWHAQSFRYDVDC